MLVTDYMVGRDEEGHCLCLHVVGVLPLDCQPGRSDLISKLSRQDLVQEFVQDGMAVDWITFPDLPADVVELLRSGKSLMIVDQSDDSVVECLIDHQSQEKLRVRAK